MVSLRSLRTFTALFAGSVVLIIGGAFLFRGFTTSIACVHTDALGRVTGFLGVDYRLTSISLEQIGYYDGCNHGSLSTLSVVPEAIGILSFLALVSYPAASSLEGVRNRTTTALVIAGMLGLALVTFALSGPVYVLLVLIAFTVIMRSRW